MGNCYGLRFHGCDYSVTINRVVHISREIIRCIIILFFLFFKKITLIIKYDRVLSESFSSLNLHKFAIHYFF